MVLGPKLWNTWNMKHFHYLRKKWWKNVNVLLYIQLNVSCKTHFVVDCGQK